ncbi:putative RNA dependent RNA polymerase [Leptomonas moramango virus]|uniref:RNA-directed RNA polymerase L n=1 Tax=Leptomonas moramango virus TaxID=1859148 RepID=A0A191Z2Z1_9VIRU|nr:putative RNA dependent RNA polymerase [Leptomonas moramango virus]ANJ59510.1 putative RNA dependent RNA polymerase [Leptomonas moramango virus]
MYRNDPYQIRQYAIGPLTFSPNKIPLKGLITHEPVVQEISNNQIGAFTIESNGDKIYAYPPQGTITHKILGEVFVTDLHNVRKLPHDLVMKTLFSKENTNNILNEPIWTTQVEGICTPDWFTISNDQAFVVEVKTFYHDHSKIFERAQSQYASVLSSCKIPAHNICICIGENEIIASEGLVVPYVLSHSLCELCLFAHMIQEYCFENKLLHDYDYSKGLETIVLPPAPLPKTDPERLVITSEMRGTWSGLPAPVSAESVINSNLRWIDPPHLLKDVDKAKLSALYKNCTSQVSHSALRDGLLLPYTTKAKLPATSEIVNWNLSHLVESLKMSTGQQKHFYIRGSLESQAAHSSEDIKRGLWSTYFQYETHNVFRAKQKQRGEPSEVKTGDVDHAGGRNSAFVSKETKEWLEPQIKTHEAKKKIQSLKPTPINLRFWSTQLCAETQAPSLIEPCLTTLEGNKVNIPYSNETWCLHSRFWQRLVEELNVGRYSAKGPWNRFHYQTIEPYDAHLFVHGTGPDSHQFYYLLVRLHPDSNPGHDYVRIGKTDWWYNETCLSMNSSKISQWLNLHERLLSLRSYWDSVFQFERDRAQDHFAASMLIGYEAKQATIDLLSLFRYTYMELCKESQHRNVYKIHSKFPQLLRTPVQSWVAWSMLKLMDLSERDSAEVTIDEDDDGALDFKKLVSWVDFKPIPNFSIILSLSYMHYAVPHPFSTGLHGRVAIMEKLLKEESTLPLNRNKIGWSSPSIEQISNHEFSVGFVKAMGKDSAKRISKVYPSYNLFWQEVSKRLKELTFSSFSTFKKSTKLNRKNVAVRDFCFATIQELAEKLNWDIHSVAGFTPYDHLNDLLDLVERDPTTMNVTIFVKDQQTGIREIFVLTMCMRILVKFMEVVSRVINTTLPNETLSVPTRKEKLIYQHTREVVQGKLAVLRGLDADKYDVITLRFSSSSDAKAWCQQFCMPVFGCFLDEALSIYGEDSQNLRDILMRILNMITKKHIHVDPRVKEWFRTHTEIQSYSDVFTRLSDLFNERSLGLYEDDSIVNKSNMMQGIPHETSSALHASYLMLASSALKQIVSSFSRSKHLDLLKIGDPIVTNMVSSDDSGIIFSLTIAFEKEKERDALCQVARIREILSRAGYNIEICKKLFAARVSLEKSTIFAETPVYEFNSKFYVGVSVHTAEIKFICSPLSLGYHTTIRERVSEALSGLSGCLREGVRQDLLFNLQLLLRRMHHRFLYSNWWKPIISERLNNLSSSLLGTVPLIQQGFVGFFNMQTLCDYSSNQVSTIAENFLKSCAITDHDEDPAYSLTLKLASNYHRVLKTFLPRLMIMANQYSSSEEGILKYLSRELFEDELVTLKMMSPGTKVAMAFVDVAKIHMASCYAATQPCIRMKGSNIKISLQNAISHLENLIGQTTAKRTHNQAVDRMIFLFNETFAVPSPNDQARFPCHLALSSEVYEHSGGKLARFQILEGWKFGFAGERLETLKWSRTIDDRITDNISKTLENFGNDIRGLDRALNDITSRDYTIHVLCHKPLNDTFTEKIASYWLSSYSRSEGRTINESRFTPEPIPEMSQQLAQSVDDVMMNLSSAALGWPISKIKSHFLRRAEESAVSCSDSLSIYGPRSPQELLLSIMAQTSSQPIDLFRLRFRGNKRIFISSTLGFQRLRTHWYKFYISNGEWTIGRILSSPIHPIRTLKQEVISSANFVLHNTDFKVDISRNDNLQLKSRHWNSDSHKNYPRELSPQIWEAAIAKINYFSINNNKYKENLPSPYDTMICKKLTEIVFCCRSNMNSWQFWEQLSSVKSTTHGPGGYALAYILQKSVQAKWQPAAPTPVEPEIPDLGIIPEDSEFEDFFNEIMDAGLEGIDFDNMDIDETKQIGAEELYSIDYFGMEEFGFDASEALKIDSRESNLAGSLVLRSGAFSHATICFLHCATKRVNDPGLFGPDVELEEALDEAAKEGNPIRLGGDRRKLEEPSSDLIQ